MIYKKQMPRCIDSPAYNYWQALYMAFYSRRLYVDVVKRWKGIGFFYVFFIIALASIPLSVRLIIEFNQFVNEQIIEPLKTIPPLELQQGEISLNKPMPYFVRSKSGAVVAMIDTRMNGSGMKGTYPELMLLVTKDKFYFRPPTLHFYSNEINQAERHEPVVAMPDKVTTKILVLSEWLESSGMLNLKWMFAALIYPFVVSFFFGLFFSLSLIFGMLAQVFSWLILRFKMTFAESVRVLIVASTVQLFVLFIFMGVNILFSGLLPICMTLCLLYFSYAVLSVKRDSTHVVRS